MKFWYLRRKGHNGIAVFRLEINQGLICSPIFPHEGYCKLFLSTLKVPETDFHTRETYITTSNATSILRMDKPIEGYTGLMVIDFDSATDTVTILPILGYLAKIALN